MDTHAPAGGGLLGSIRGLADTLLATARDRLELIAIELKEEKLRFVQLFVWVSAAIFSAILAITFASLTIVYLFWETARLAVLIGFTIVYGVAFAVLLSRCRKLVARQPKPFESSIDELSQDHACIRPES